MSPSAARCVSSKSELRGVSTSFAATCPCNRQKKTERVSAKPRALLLFAYWINYNSRFLVCDEKESCDKLRLGARTSCPQLLLGSRTPPSASPINTEIF